MKRIRSRPRLVLGAALLLLALFRVRPGAAHLELRIAGTIGQALERPVEIGTVKVHLLPTPGFDLSDFVVREDPAFGAEPILRSQEVTAGLRLSSLLHRRLEISRLVLTEPSLNLVRNPDGRWNIAHVLERASLTTVAPTAAKPSAARPAFPYIEAVRGRINFKFGAEKKSFALTDADYAIWQDSENTWGMRLKARPLRTDFNISDTGQVKINGTWQRASSLPNTPLQFTLQWDQAQLGQLTKLVSGQDRGWRGGVRLSANLSGTAADLLVHGDASVEDFRRYDILGGGVLTLRASCDAHYSTLDRGFHQIACQGPVRGGTVSVHGDLLSLPAPRSYDLTLVAQQVPVQAVLAVVRRAKKDLPEDLQAGGKLSASFHARAGKGQHASEPALQGAGRLSDLRLKSVATGTELVLGQVPLTLLPAANSEGRALRSPGEKPPSGPYLSLGPFALRLGPGAPATARGWLSRSAYNFHVEGDAQLQPLLQAARLLGLAAPQPTVDGSARVDLQVAGQWAGLGAPLAIGSLHLHALQAEVHGLNAPLEIAAANLHLTPELVTVDVLSASLVGTHWTGSLEWPRGCPSAGACAVTFALHGNTLDIEQLSQLLRPNPAPRPWYGFLSPENPVGPPFLARVRAVGKLTADRLIIRKLTATHVATDVQLERGRLHLADLRADVLGGRHRGEWQADFAVTPPAYSGEGTLERVSLAQVSDLMEDAWITGTGSAAYQLKTAGYTAATLLASASGTLRFEMREGAFPHVILGGTALHVRRFAGGLALQDGQFEMHDARLESPGGTFLVNGTASMAKRLDFKLAQEGAPAFSVTGTLAEPRTVPAETQAALRPSATQR